MHNFMSAPGGEAAQHRGAVQGITHPDARSKQSLPLRWVDGYKMLGPWGLSSGHEVPWFIHSSSDQHGHQQGDVGGQLHKADHHVETLLQAAMSPVAVWFFTRDQLSALLLLFCCYCEQTKSFAATVSRHYLHLQPWANYIVSLKFLFHFETLLINFH